MAALDLAATRIEAFHRLQVPADLQTTDAAGLTLGMRWTPLDAVGLYVPGGKAAYPSSVLMNAIPARVAGVPRIAMCVPTPGRRAEPAGAGRRAPRRRGGDLPGRRRAGDRGAGLRHRQHRAGRSHRRAGQRLCRRGQAAGVRPRRHRRDRRPVRGRRARRCRERSALRRRRSAGPGRARRGGAGDPDHRRCRVRRSRSPRRSRRNSRPCRAPPSPARAGRRTAPSSWCATGTRRSAWSTGWRPSTCN